MKDIDTFKQQRRDLEDRIELGASADELGKPVTRIRALRDKILKAQPSLQHLFVEERHRVAELRSAVALGLVDELEDLEAGCATIRELIVQRVLITGGRSGVHRLVAPDGYDLAQHLGGCASCIARDYGGPVRGFACPRCGLPDHATDFQDDDGVFRWPEYIDSV